MGLQCHRGHMHADTRPAARGVPTVASSCHPSNLRGMPADGPNRCDHGVRDCGGACEGGGDDSFQGDYTARMERSVVGRSLGGPSAPRGPWRPHSAGTSWRPLGLTAHNGSQLHAQLHALKVKSVQAWSLACAMRRRHRTACVVRCTHAPRCGMS